MKKISIIILIVACILTIFTLHNINNSGDKTDKTPQENPTLNEPVHILTTVNIGSMGDLLIHDPVLTANRDESTKTYNFEKIFTYLEPYINELDYAVINMEGTLAENSFSGYPLFRCPDNLIDCAKSCGFKMFLTANNHSNDAGAKGFIRTIEVLKNKNVDFTGTRKQIEEKKYIIKDIKGIKVGVVNYTYGEINDNGVVSVNGIPSTAQNSKLFNVFDYKKLDEFYKEQEEIIKEMRENKAERIIYYIHWGNEYEIKENATQRVMAQKLSDLGVDVIIGGHPHVVQPMDTIHSDISGKNTICIYSLGNAVSNQRQELMDLKSGHTEDGVLFKISFSKYSDGTVLTSDVEILPTWVNLYKGSAGKNVYQIVPLDKNIDWNNNFNIKAATNGLERANKSYNRTIQIISPGLSKAKDIILQTLREAYPEIYSNKN